MNSRIKKLKESLLESNLRVFKTKQSNYQPRSEKELLEVLKIKAEKRSVDLNDIDVSLLTVLPKISDVRFFQKNNFYVDEWDVSNVQDFLLTFEYCLKFNSDLSSWDTSNGVYFHMMFDNCEEFNQPISNFDVSNAMKIEWFLKNCKVFNQSLHTFKFPRYLKDVSMMFDGCYNFNQDVSMWDVSNIEDFSNMFRQTKSFKQDLSNWNVSKAEYWNGIFFLSRMENYPELMPEKFRGDYLK